VLAVVWPVSGEIYSLTFRFIIPVEKKERKKRKEKKKKRLELSLGNLI